jgi:SAM-dependent methyltransferase
VARSAGLDVRAGTAERLPFGDQLFDAVIMAHSLEHCYSPRLALLEAYRVMRPGGQVIITTPNTASFARMCFGRYWSGWEMPRHLVIFDRRSLRALLTNVGLRPIRVRGSASGSGWIDSLLNLLRSRGWTVPDRGTGLALARHLVAGVALVTNSLPWADEMEVVAEKASTP